MNVNDLYITHMCGIAICLMLGLQMLVCIYSNSFKRTCNTSESTKLECQVWNYITSKFFAPLSSDSDPHQAQRIYIFKGCGKGLVDHPKQGSKGWISRVN